MHKYILIIYAFYVDSKRFFNNKEEKMLLLPSQPLTNTQNQLYKQHHFSCLVHTHNNL